MIEQAIETLSNLGEVRIWNRDGAACWEVIKQGEVKEIGFKEPDEIIAYGADAASLIEYAGMGRG